MIIKANNQLSGGYDNYDNNSMLANIIEVMLESINAVAFFIFENIWDFILY